MFEAFILQPLVSEIYLEPESTCVRVGGDIVPVAMANGGLYCGLLRELHRCGARSLQIAGTRLRFENTHRGVAVRVLRSGLYV